MKGIRVASAHAGATLSLICSVSGVPDAVICDASSGLLHAVMGVQCAIRASCFTYWYLCNAKECERAAQDMERRKKRKEMELLWRGAASFGTDADVFTGNFASGGSPV